MILQNGHARVTAADYVYEIKRLVHPQLHTPIAGVMSEYIVGLKDYAATLHNPHFSKRIRMIFSI